MPTDSCIDWPGCRTRAGYGRVRDLYVHRFVWELFNGPIPPGLNVLHRCDRPPCVNPRHLFLGTHGDNMHDMIAKGRACDELKARPGAFNGNSKLSEADVLAIRQRYIPRRPKQRSNLRALAAEFGVSDSTLWHIARRITWRHLP